MPAHYLRELGVDLGSTFSHFSEAAQRLGVYTANDYVDILESLISLWSIDKAMIGSLEGPVLDRFAQAGERDGSQPLATLLPGLADSGDRRASDDPLAELDGATLEAIVTEARGAARLLRAMLFRETAAADALAARLQAYEAGRYSLVR
jgi:hypothetical protein